MGVEVDVWVGVKVMVGVRVGMLVLVNVGEGVMVATSAENKAVQAVWFIRDSTAMKENNKIFLFILTKLTTNYMHVHNFNTS